MPLTQVQKKEVIADVQARVGEKPQLLFCDFTGTNVTDLQSLRRKLREVGSDLKAAKKTLLSLAFADTEATKAVDITQWENAVSVVFAPEGEVEAAKILHEFAKDHEETFQLLGGLFEGNVLDQAAVVSLAQTPGRQELYGQLVGLLNAVPTNFVRVLNAAQRDFVIVINQIAEQKA